MLVCLHGYGGNHRWAFDVVHVPAAAAHVGLQYHFDRRWSLVGSIAVADVQSDLTATTFLRGSSSVVVMQGKTHINFHPIVYTVAIGYSF